MNVGENHSMRRNNIFTKAATAIVGLSMAIGIGVSFRINDRYSEVKADVYEASISIQDYGISHNWVSGTRYCDITIVKDILFVKGSSIGADNSKYYSASNPHDWRFYQAQLGSFTIYSADNYIITSLSITFGSSSYGALYYEETQIISEEEFDVNSSHATFYVRSTSGSNGIIDIQSISVNYRYASSSLDTFVKVRDINDISGGDEIVFVNQTGTYACGFVPSSGNNVAAVQISLTNNNLVIDQANSSGIQIFKLISSNSTNRYGLYLGSAYLYSNSASNDSLKVSILDPSTTPSGKSAWNLSCVDETFSLINVSNDPYSLQFDDQIFSQYSKTTKENPCIYKKIANQIITSNDDVSIIEQGNTLQLTSTCPINISWSSSDNDIATIDNNGLATAISAGEVAIKAIANNYATASFKLYIAPTQSYIRISDSNDLYNGQKIVIANSLGTHSMGLNIGEDDIPSVEIATDDPSTFSSGNVTEYTIWNLNGHWIFYAEGYYLSCTATGNNLRRSLSINEYCYFDISITDNIASIVCANENVASRYMQYNDSNSIFNCYSSANQVAISIYTPNDETSSSYNIVASGYERCFLKVGFINIKDEGTNLCKTNNYYSFAKDVYNNYLSNDVKNELSNIAIERLQAWATANGDNLASNPGTIEEKQKIDLISISDNNNNNLIIVIITISLVSLLTLSGYFYIRRKHH